MSRLLTPTHTCTHRHARMQLQCATPCTTPYYTTPHNTHAYTYSNHNITANLIISHCIQQIHLCGQGQWTAMKSHDMGKAQ